MEYVINRKVEYVIRGVEYVINQKVEYVIRGVEYVKKKVEYVMGVREKKDHGA